MTKVCYRKEAEKDIRKLSKKFRNFEDDLEVYEDILKMHSKEHTVPQDACMVSNIGNDFHAVWHAEKFYCEALKRTNKIRVIFNYDPYEDIIWIIEIYFKGDKNNHDQNRIKDKNNLIPKKCATDVTRFGCPINSVENS